MLDKKVEETGRGVALTLYGEATIQNASELKSIIVEQLVSSESVTLNLSYVTDCDLSFLQLVCGAHKMSVRDGRPFMIGEHSPLVDGVALSSGFVRTSGCISGGDHGCLWQVEKTEGAK